MNCRTSRIICRIALFSLSLGGVALHAQTVQEFPIGPGTSYDGIAAGTDGNIWFTDYGANEIGIFKPNGIVARLSSPGIGPDTMVLGPDGNIWFSESKQVTRVNYTDHSMQPFSLAPCSIESGLMADSTALWFAEECSDGEYIIKLTPKGAMPPAISRFHVGTGSLRSIFQLVHASDGNIWFTEYSGQKIGRLDPGTGLITESPVPHPSILTNIAASADGSLWFVEYGAEKLARIDMRSGHIGEMVDFDWFAMATPVPTGLLLGRDNNFWSIDGSMHVWRTTPYADHIAKTQIAAKEHSISFSQMTLAEDGNIWFTQSKGTSLGMIRMDGIFVDDFEGDPSP